MLTVPLIRAADELAARQVKETYVGTYTSPPTQEQTINSTLTLTYTPTPGLEISEWVSNSTDLLSVMPEHFQFPRNKKFHVQLIPTRSLAQRWYSSRMVCLVQCLVGGRIIEMTNQWLDRGICRLFTPVLAPSLLILCPQNSRLLTKGSCGQMAPPV